MINRRKDLPELDPKELALPPSPGVEEIRTRTYQNAIGEESLEVVVVIQDLTPAQLKDRGWTRPIEQGIRARLDEMGEERFALVLFRQRADLAAEQAYLRGE